MRYVAFFLVFSAVLAGGCRAEKEPAPQEIVPPDYGKLPGLKRAANQKLREELARIVEERGTPELLEQTSVAEVDNAAAVLRELFPEHKIRSILEKSERIFPPKKLALHPAGLQKAINFRKQYDSQRRKAREALRRPKCDFGIRFTAGFPAELELIDVVRICARLETFQAAEALAGDKPDQAIDSLEVILRLAACLGKEKHGEARAQAAFIRTEAFVLLQAIVQDEKIARTHLDRLYELVQAQWKSWPGDADATVGDRALGMHAYEMVRAGNLTDLLTVEEFEQFQKEGVLRELAAAAARSVDQDELYYLQTMRKILAACDRPYYLRAELFDTIRDELQQMRNSPEFPVVAARLLLPDIRKLHVMQAQDRANWEAWSMALALATRRHLPPSQTNPLTGEKYQASKVENLTVVRNFGSGRPGDDPSIVVPDLADPREPDVRRGQ